MFVKTARKEEGISYGCCKAKNQQETSSTVMNQQSGDT